MKPAPTRRAILLGGLAALSPGLAGCGFHPVYAPGAFGGGAAAEALGLVAVENIPERAGQLLRQSLQQRLEGAGAPDRKQYDLTVALAFTEEGIAILPDNSTSRLRYTGAASFILRARDSGRTVLATGSARQIDAANILNNQYFALDLETETVMRRIMAGLADQITLQLGTYFHKNPPKEVGPGAGG